MIGQIGTLKIPLDGYYFVGNRGGSAERLDVIPKLRKINLFIGANNSGKSRLLRAIATTQVEYVPRWLDISIVQEKVRHLIGRLREQLPTNFLREGTVITLMKELQRLTSHRFVAQHENRSGGVRGVLQGRLGQPNAVFANDERGAPLLGEELERIARRMIDEELQLDVGTALDYFDVKKLRRIYIPVVRGLRRFGGNTDAIGTQFHTEYFNSNLPGLEVVTGYDFYATVKELREGDEEERMRLRKYEEFLSTVFFENKSVELVPHRDQALHIKIGMERQRPIHELGDGIQSLIVMTYQVCLRQGQQGLVLIEEPELYLHPGGLRTFIRAILEHELFAHYQFFFATHSNHLLDLSLDYDETATYSVHKVISNLSSGTLLPEFKIESEDYGSEQSLSYLGVRNSSVYLANCTIWVEGITDRWYIRKYLSLIPESQGFKNYIEDLHYSIVEYAGSNMDHWSFLPGEPHPINVDRLCGKAFVIMDKDDSDRKTKWQERVKAIIGERLKVLPVREIENTLSPSVLKLIVRKYARKNENTDGFDGFEQEDYRDIRLAPFIDAKISITHKFAGDYEVLTDKTKFCERAILNMSSWDDLSEDAKCLALEIAQFIKGSNS